MVNHIGALQEHLQAMAPGLGARPEELYRIEERKVGEQSFRAQVILLSTLDASERREMPWCRAATGKQVARNEAARLALAELVGTAARPHDAGAVAVGLSYVSLSAGAAGRGVAAANQPAVLPMLSDAMLAVEPVVCLARQSSVTITASERAETLGAYDLTFDHAPEHGGGAAVSSRPDDGKTEEFLDRYLDRIPPNLGQLGEEFASEWLQHQTWVAARSVQWLNAREEGYERVRMRAHARVRL